MKKMIDTRSLSRAAWVEARRSGIGGSDASTIMGVNPYRSLYTLWADKLGMLPEQEDNEAMKMGRDLEEYVARRFCTETGLKVKREYHILQHDAHLWMLANIDRRIVGESAGLECKTSKDLHLKRFRNGEFPVEYYAQCQHYLAVTGLERWYLAVLIYGTDFKVFTIERDEEDIAALIEAERAFWENHVITRIPPPADGSRSTQSALSALYPQSDDQSIMTDTTGLVEAYAQRKREAVQLNAEVTELENKIKASMGEAERIVGGKYIALWKSATRSTLDEKALRAGHPEIVFRDYTKTTTYRRFTLKEVMQDG